MRCLKPDRFRAAAERLNLSQPAVSIALGNLEAELGFRLFHRDRGFFAPTNEALLLHDEVQQGITALARVDQRAKEIRSGATGAISIATNGAMSYNFLPQVIADFQRDFPETHVELRVHSSRRIAAWVGSRQTDIGLIDAPVPVAGAGFGAARIGMRLHHAGRRPLWPGTRQ